MADIHPTAIVSEGAELGEGVQVGPYSVIGEHVRLGAGTKIMAHVVIDGHTTFGRECQVYPFASIGTATQDLKFRGGTTYVDIGDRTVIREYVTVNSATNEGETTKVGAGCFVMAYCHVAHACDVGDGVIMANCATLAGHVKVGANAVVGGMTAVHQFVHIGALAMLGGCSRIAQDCPPYMTTVGNPPKVRGLNLVGLRRRGMPEATRRLLLEAYRCLYRRGLSQRDAVAAIRENVEAVPEVEALLAFIEGSERGLTR